MVQLCTDMQQYIKTKRQRPSGKMNRLLVVENFKILIRIEKLMEREIKKNHTLDDSHLINLFKTRQERLESFLLELSVLTDELSFSIDSTTEYTYVVAEKMVKSGSYRFSVRKNLKNINSDQFSLAIKPIKIAKTFPFGNKFISQFEKHPLAGAFKYSLNGKGILLTPRNDRQNTHIQNLQDLDVQMEIEDLISKILREDIIYDLKCFVNDIIKDI